jgi:co-chaperonin GroES (HSP10)
MNNSTNQLSKTNSGLNKSGLKPLGRAVLVEPYEKELSRTTIAVPDTVRERTQMVETRAIVIEAGPAAWDDEPVPRAQPGDRVLISRFSGSMAKGTADGKTYRLVNDTDIYCQIEVD